MAINEKTEAAMPRPKFKQGQRVKVLDREGYGHISTLRWCEKFQLWFYAIQFKSGGDDYQAEVNLTLAPCRTVEELRKPNRPKFYHGQKLYFTRPMAIDTGNDKPVTFDVWEGEHAKIETDNGPMTVLPEFLEAPVMFKAGHPVVKRSTGERLTVLGPVEGDGTAQVWIKGETGMPRLVDPHEIEHAAPSFCVGQRVKVLDEPSKYTGRVVALSNLLGGCDFDELGHVMVPVIWDDSCLIQVIRAIDLVAVADDADQAEASDEIPDEFYAQGIRLECLRIVVDGAAASGGTLPVNQIINTAQAFEQYVLTGGHHAPILVATEAVKRGPWPPK